MFSEGDTFEDSLRDAQNKGYAERNPDADVLGVDACRKIAILTSLVTGILPETDAIHTEGITAICKNDVTAAESLGLSIKLLGRCIISEEGMHIMVAPFMLGDNSPLSGVHGVYNAIEIIGDPIGNLMFYGQGAGAGATASAVVGDLMQIMCSGRNTAQPKMVKSADILPFCDFKCRHYLSVCAERSRVEQLFGAVDFIGDTEEIAFVTEEITEKELTEKIKNLSVKSHIRLL
jgi:homoserine dehydrogenase